MNSDFSAKSTRNPTAKFNKTYNKYHTRRGTSGGPNTEISHRKIPNTTNTRKLKKKAVITASWGDNETAPLHTVMDPEKIASGFHAKADIFREARPSLWRERRVTPS